MQFLALTRASSRSLSSAASNGPWELTTFAPGKVGRSPISAAPSSPRGPSLLPSRASPQGSDELGLRSALHLGALPTPSRSRRQGCSLMLIIFILILSLQALDPSLWRAGSPLGGSSSLPPRFPRGRGSPQGVGVRRETRRGWAETAAVRPPSPPAGRRGAPLRTFAAGAARRGFWKVLRRRGERTPSGPRRWWRQASPRVPVLGGAG